MSDKKVLEDPIIVESQIHGSDDDGDIVEWAPKPPVRREPQQYIDYDDSNSTIDTGVAQPVTGPVVPADTASEAKRAVGLDALRGLYLISMTLGFAVASDMLPAWMYHRQFPPPGDAAVNIAGISWRDMAYASFLFSMAAALPITLSRLIDKGVTEIGIVLAALRRAFMLFVFALLIGHSNTYFIGYTNVGRAIAITGFIVMALLFTRKRSNWNGKVFSIVNKFGWIAAIAFLAFTPTLYGKVFSPSRADDIIVGLAIAALLGSVLWYFTRKQLGVRLAVLVGVVALYLGAHGDGWLQDLWWTSPVPWLLKPANLSLLTVVIPGTIAGDLLLQWMRTPGQRKVPGSWSSGRYVLLSLLCIAVTPLIVFGLYNRWFAATTQIAVVLCALGLALVFRAKAPADIVVKRMFLWSAMWLLLGLFLEPSEGGIKKVPETLSYFFTVTGATSMLLVALTSIVDVLERRKWATPMIMVGQNPMLCYVLYTVLLNSIFEMIPAMQPFLRATPAQSLLRTVLSTILVVLIVQFFTRKRIFWRT